MGSREARECKICGKKLEGRFNLHLMKVHNLTPEEYYLKYINKKPQCAHCGKYNTKFYNIKKGYNKYCSKSCQIKDAHKNNPNMVEALKPYQKDNWKYLMAKEVRQTTTLKRTTPEALKKAEETRVKNGARKRTCEAAHSIEARKKALNTLLKNNPDHFVEMSRKGGYCNTKKGFLFTTKAGKVFYRSSWEKIIYNALDKDDKILWFDVEPKNLFINLSRGKRYKPDILVIYTNGEKFLIEIKPEYQIQENEEKFKAAIEFCKLNKLNWQVWTQNNCEYLKDENIKERNKEIQHSYTSFRCDNR